MSRPEFQPSAYRRPLPPDMLAPFADPAADAGIGTFASRTLEDLDTFVRHVLENPHAKESDQTYAYDLGRYLYDIRHGWMLDLYPNRRYVPTEPSPESISRSMYRAVLLTHGIVHAALGHTGDALGFLRQAELGDDESPLDAAWAIRAAILHDLLADRPELTQKAAACRDIKPAIALRPEIAAARLVDAELFAYRRGNRNAALHRYAMARILGDPATAAERHVAAAASRAEARYRASLGDAAGARRVLRNLTPHVTEADSRLHTVATVSLSPELQSNRKKALGRLRAILLAGRDPAIPSALAALAEHDPENLDTTVDTAAKLLNQQQHPEFHVACASLLLQIATRVRTRMSSRLFLSDAEREILRAYEDLIERATRGAVDSVSFARSADTEPEDPRLSALTTELLLIRGHAVHKAIPRRAVQFFRQAAQTDTGSTHLRGRRVTARALSTLAAAAGISGAKNAVRELRIDGYGGDPDPEVRLHVACGEAAYAHTALDKAKLQAAAAAIRSAIETLEGLPPSPEAATARFDAAILQTRCILRRTARGTRPRRLHDALNLAESLAPGDGSRQKDLDALATEIQARALAPVGGPRRADNSISRAVRATASH